jgi:phenylacetate-coenzyme A ligase PaaK-like adenylate-forming protein
MLQTLRFILRIRSFVNASQMTPAQVHNLQQKRFRELLRHAHQHSPFYRRRYQGIDLERCSITDLPPLSKVDMMANYDNFPTDRSIQRAELENFMSDEANLGKYFLGKYVVCHTSGSQGQPALIVQEPEAGMVTMALQMARGNALKKSPLTAVQRLLRPARWALVTLKPDFYPSGIMFAYMPPGARPLYRLQWSSLFDPIAETVAKLNAFQPDYLTGYNSILEPLARQEQEGRLKLCAGGCLRQVTNISEPLSDEVRLKLEDTWGVHVSNQYGMGECPHLSYGCPHAPGSHVNSDVAILEVVDDHYRPVPPGVPGAKILVTNLINHVQPFIRYEIDDIVTMSARPCVCGSHLPLVQSVIGRAQDKLWVEVGGKTREMPLFPFRVGLQKCFEVAEYQIVQTGHNRYVLRVVPLTGQSIDAERVHALVTAPMEVEGLKDIVDVRVQVIDAIQNDPRSGKLKRVVNLIGPAPVAKAA